MRTDVKLGIAISMALVLVVGGYFLFKTDQGAPISIAETPATTPNATKPATPADTKSNPANRGLRTDGASRPAANPANQRSPQPRTTPGSADGTRTAQGPSNPQNAARPTDSTSSSPPQPQPTNFTLPQNPERTASNPATSNPGTTDASVPAGPRSDVPTRTDQPGAIPGLVTSDSSTGMTANPPSGSASPVGDTSKPPTPARDAAVEIHRAQPGDTLISLAQAYYGSAAYVPLLREHNPQVTDPSRLTPGTAVKIPAVPPGWQAKAPTSTPTSPTGSLASNQPNPSGRNAVPNSGSGKSGRTYTVKSGDSFYRIAEQQLGNPNRWKELLTMNTAVVKGDPTRLRPGQVLTLPES